MNPQETDAVQRCFEEFKKFRGIPPYDGPENIVRSDGYFYKSIERGYSREVFDAAKVLADREESLWKALRERFLRRGQ